MRNLVKMKMLKDSHLRFICLLSLFLTLSTAAGALATTTLNKTFVDYTNGTINVTWSSFSGNVNISLYRGTSDRVAYHKTDQPPSGTSTLGPGGWEYRCDYRIKVELRSNPSVYEWAQYNGDYDFCVGSLNVTYPQGGETITKGQNLNITWTSTNLTDNVQIDLCKGSSNTVATHLATVSNSGSSAALIPAGVSDGNDYKIGISNDRSDVNDGQVWDYSDNYFTIEAVSLPAPPALTYPANDGTVPSDQNINFQWTNSPGGVWTQIKVCRDSAMSDVVITAEGANNTIISDSFFNPGETYYWQARSRLEDESLGYGLYGPTPPSSFTIEAVSLPDPPTLTYPANGGIVPIDQNINFQWTNSSGAVWTQIKVCRDSAMSDVVITAEGANNTIISDSFFNPGETYYWQARSRLEDESLGYGLYGPTPPSSFIVNEEGFGSPVFTPLYRLYKPSVPRDHLYTANTAERDNAITSYGFEYEGIECYISKEPFAGGVPLYRLYWSAQNSHFYTTSVVERDEKLLAGYMLEGAPDGIIGYVYQNTGEGLASLHRLKQPDGSDSPYYYFLTTNQCEITARLSEGYTEADPAGVGYVPITVIKEWDAHHRPQANFGGVDLGTGAYRGLNNLALVMKGPGPSLAFAHYYNSFNFNRAPMGMGWSHNLCSSIFENEANNRVFVFWGNGTVSEFTKTGPGDSDYKDESGNHDILTLFHDPTGMNYGYNLTKKDQTVYRFRRFNAYPYGKDEIVILEIEDWRGNKLTFDYQDVTTVSDERGRALKLTYYYPSGQLQKVEEIVSGETKRTVSFTYDSDGRLESFVDAEGRPTRYQYYDEPGTERHSLLKSITYPKGNIVLIDYYEDLGKVKSVKDSSSINESTIEYIPSSGEAVVTDPEHNVNRYFHTGNLLTAFKGGNDSTWVTIERTNLQSPNLPTKVTDKKDNVTEYDYDDRGNLTKIINAEGKKATYRYNDKNNLIESTEFYDSSVTSPPKTVYHYDSSENRLDWVANPENETIYLYYYANNQLEKIRDGRGYETTFEYDSYENLSQIKDAKDNITKYENDYAGRTTAVIDAEDIRTVYSYDNNDHPEDVVNYSKTGQTVLRIISRLYDANGNLDSVSWSNQGAFSETRYEYDNRDRLEKVIKPGSLEKIFSFYETDLPKTRKDYNNHITNYEYDDHNRLKKTRYPDFTKVDISRDANGNVTSIINKNGESSFIYNSLNLMQSYTDPFTKTVQYSYNDQGRIKTITYPGSGKVVTYTYDNAGRLKTVEDWNEDQIVYEYDAAGNLSEIHRPNGLDTRFDYDNASRLTGITERNESDIVLWSYAYSLDKVGNHSLVDSTNEPLAITSPPENTSYTNDKTTNRLLTAGSNSYTYDNNGNRKTFTNGSGTTNYTWDYENMLTRMSSTGQDDIEYTYDGMNNRIASKIGSEITRYVLDLNGSMSRVLAETDENGVIKAYYIYGHGLISRIDAETSERRFYHFNNRGDTVALSNDSNVITDKYAYDEYGKAVNDPGNTTPNPFKFIGQYGVMDEGSGLNFMRARYYDAEVGKFLSEDPLGFEGGDWNLYGYVGGNPLIKIDISGKIIASLIGGQVCNGIEVYFTKQIIKESNNRINIYRKHIQFHKQKSDELEQKNINNIFSKTYKRIQDEINWAENKIEEEINYQIRLNERLAAVIAINTVFPIGGEVLGAVGSIGAHIISTGIDSLTGPWIP